MPKIELVVLFNSIWFKIFLTILSIFVSMLLNKMSRRNNKNNQLFEKEDMFIGISISFTSTMMVFNYIMELSKKISNLKVEINQCIDSPLKNVRLKELINMSHELNDSQTKVTIIFFLVYIVALMFFTYYIRQKGWDTIRRTSELNYLHGIWIPNIIGFFFLLFALHLIGTQYGN